MRHTILLAVTIGAAIAATALRPAAAQSGPAASQPNQSESNSQSSNMGPGTGNNGAANNGVGTTGSLDHDAGKASSTVAGVKGGSTSFGGNSAQGTGKMESDPTQGGGSQTPK